MTEIRILSLPHRVVAFVGHVVHQLVACGFVVMVCLIIYYFHLDPPTFKHAHTEYIGVKGM